MTSNKQRVNYSRQHFIGTLVGVRWIPLTLVDGAQRFFFPENHIFSFQSLAFAIHSRFSLLLFFTQYPHRHIYCCCCAAVTVPAAGKCQLSYITLCMCKYIWSVIRCVCVGDICHLWQCDIIHRKRTKHGMFCAHKNAYSVAERTQTHTQIVLGYAGCWNVPADSIVTPDSTPNAEYSFCFDFRHERRWHQRYPNIRASRSWDTNIFWRVFFSTA